MATALKFLIISPQNMCLVHLLLSLHFLEESFDSQVPGTPNHLAFPSSHLPNPFLPLLPQLTLWEPGLRYREAGSGSLSHLGMARGSGHLAQVWECGARAQRSGGRGTILLLTPDPGMEYVPIWSLQPLGGHPLIQFGKAGDRSWEGEIHYTSSPLTQQSCNCGEGSCVYHGVTGQGQAPGTL